MPRKKEVNEDRHHQFKPLSENQAIYVDSIDSNVITLVTGVAGSGKTSVACAKAVEYLRKEYVERVVVTKPAVESGQSLGYLPGAMSEKFSPFCVPLSEEFEKFSTKTELKNWKVANKIQFIPTAYLRGYNLHDAFIIADESASFTYNQLLLILTRLGKNSKLVMVADIKQSDLNHHLQGGFEDVCLRLRELKGVGQVTLGIEDVVRNDLIGEIIRRLT